VVDFSREPPKKINFILRLVDRASLRADIVYGTNHEFGFDYLRTNMAWPRGSASSATYFAIVDEVDNILIDEAAPPHHLRPAEEILRSTINFTRGAPAHPEDYEIDEPAAASPSPRSRGHLRS